MGTRLSKAALSTSWFFAVIALMAISIVYSGESTQFHGITDDQEQTIRFASAVEIVRYGYVAGQEVKSGDVIVEVRQPDLHAELQMVQEKIHALTYGNRETDASMESEIVQLNADLRGTLTELDSQIRKLRARETASAGLLHDDSAAGSRGRSPIAQEIDSLQIRKRAVKTAATARINDLRSRLSTTERPVDAQIAELEKRQQDLERQSDELRVVAQFDGRVGSILFQVGETAAPYQPVLTLHGSTPTFVKGYIHESVLNGVQLGQTVWVQSSSSSHDLTWHAGVVESLGSRIVEFPDRLKVNPFAQAWGREVVVQLGREHSLLLGEKVSIQLKQPVSSFAGIKTAIASISE